MAKVSVIIPVYNTEKFLKQCLDSVCSQTLQDIEIICINDCSTDNSLSLLMSYAKRDSRLCVVNLEENKGPGYVRNLGIKKATGEYIAFIDSDDFIEADFYLKLYTEAQKNSCDVVRGNVAEIHDNEIYYPYSALIDKIKQNKIYFNGLFVAAIYSKELIKRNSIFFLDEIIYGEDRLFPLQAVFYAKNFSVVADVFYYYVRHNESGSNIANDSERKLADFIYSTDLLLNFMKKEFDPSDTEIVLDEFIAQAMYFAKSIYNLNLLKFIKKLFEFKAMYCKTYKMYLNKIIFCIDTNNIAELEILLLKILQIKAVRKKIAR